MDQSQERIEEISIGLKNAVDRGESLPIAEKTFLNAGYNKKEVMLAAQKLGQAQRQTPQPAQTKPQKKENQKTLQTSKTQTSPQNSLQNIKPQNPKKHFPRWLIITLIIVSALILIGATVFGLFWDKFF